MTQNTNTHTHELLKALLNSLNTENDLSANSRGDEAFDVRNAAPARVSETVASPTYTETRLSEDAVGCMSGWLDNETLQNIENKQIIQQLDEILLLLIAIRGRSSGKELREDLNRLFGADLSPGTVYPRLSELASDGVLNSTELAKRKIYSISDAETVIHLVEPRIHKLLTYSAVLNLLMSECKSDQTRSDAGNK
ncbi:PadR family transcription activator GvpE [Natronomonas moolapensis 8.8.11]|uniref:PadR family transcription activator GvpE n=1 Tax=Natronomonas moolapensis (strain DSM 18674 / CECT 7526 / JCM 14361 / 8.8.11) TaxID=268739 RepID=M1XPI3_NATM8|nr:PadR family transcriptional regulator [Natronomonas moolapensis]CCQ35949.1 PadR family transcription activator GvpE [Natronomonas moolapensis 8.8.11]